LRLRVDGGEVVAVLGPNARGKTTLLTCLAGVRAPAEGHVAHTGGIGYVPQTHDADHHFTADEMVVMGRARRIRAWATPTKADQVAADEALARVGMADQAHRTFADLSGGQRQLVLIARALVNEPATIVLDEPTSALDLRNQRIVLSVVADLAAQGMGVVLTTHDPTHALHVSSRTLLMDEDVRLGPTSDLLTAPCLSTLYRTPVCTAPVAFASGERTVVAPDLLADMACAGGPV
jgi:iron complex transport system ATP-binding protein